MSLKSCKQQVSHSQTHVFDTFAILTELSLLSNECRWILSNAPNGHCRRHSSAADFDSSMNRLQVRNSTTEFLAIFFASSEWFASCADHGWTSSAPLESSVLILRSTKFSNVALDSECDRFGRVIIIELNQWNGSDWDKRQSRIRKLLDSLVHWLDYWIGCNSGTS